MRTQGGFEQEEMIEEDGGSTGRFVMEEGVGFSEYGEAANEGVLQRLLAAQERTPTGRQLAARWGALDMGGDVEEEMDRPPGISDEEWRASLPGEAIEVSAWRTRSGTVVDAYTVTAPDRTGRRGSPAGRPRCRRWCSRCPAVSAAEDFNAHLFLYPARRREPGSKP
jgi:formylglycine-generating enzyme required for sulfatase activity